MTKYPSPFAKISEILTKANTQLRIVSPQNHIFPVLSGAGLKVLPSFAARSLKNFVFTKTATRNTAMANAPNKPKIENNWYAFAICAEPILYSGASRVSWKKSTTAVIALSPPCA